MYSLVNKLRILSFQCPKYRGLKSVKFAYRWKSTAVAPPRQSIAVANLCDKLKCSQVVAENIYDKYPTMRSVDAIRSDSLQMLSEKLSLLSIVENPELITMDCGNMNCIHRIQIALTCSNHSIALDLLERKIKLLNTAEPRSLDNFAPFLLINEKDLKDIVYKRMLNERHEVGKCENRIYYISEKLEVFLLFSCNL